MTQAPATTTEHARRSARPSQSATGRRPEWLHQALWTTGVICVYLALSLAANWNVWTHGVTHTIQTSGGADIQEAIWFLAQTPWAIIHGHNPFVNSSLNYPFGINLLDNGSSEFLGLIGLPITVLLGPIATFNILVNLAYASSATAAYFMVRRFVSWQPAAFFGGLIYGFSPFAIATGNGHIFLLFSAVPPLVVIVLDRVFRTRQTSPTLGGALFAACLVGQFYISSEVFASLIIVLGLALAIALAHHAYHRTSPDRSTITRFVLITVVVGSIPLGYGAWMAIAGPHHIVGPAQTRVDLNGLSADPVGWIAPTINQRFSMGFADVGDPLVAQRDSQWHIVIDNASENGTYIGIPLLLLLLVGVVALRRLPLIRFSALMAILVTSITLGSRLHINGHLTRIPLPFIVLAHLPLLDSSVAARYSLFFWLFVALILGVILDRSRAAIGRLNSPKVVSGGACLLLAVVALLPLTPSWPYASGPWATPAWFTGGARSLPLGTSVLVYPVANPGNSSAMVWQAQAHMNFQMPGGYAVFASPEDGKASFFPPPSAFESALISCAVGREPTETPAQVRSSLTQFHIEYVAVPLMAPNSHCAANLFDHVLGPPRTDQGVLLWRVSANAS